MRPAHSDSFILASASPRRRELLQRFDFPFAVMPSNVDEELYAGLPGKELVLALAQAKARDVAQHAAGLILAADTVVVCEGRLLGKPADRSAAAEMLSLLAGRGHEVYTGLALLQTATQHLEMACERSEVYFRQIDTAELERYLDCGEYSDKAGAYAAQGRAAAFITGVYGCYHNVIGLPLHCLDNLLRAFGFSLL